MSVYSQTEYGHTGIFEGLNRAPPLHCHAFCSIITSFRYTIVWAPLHVFAGLSHHQTLFWDRWVYNDWLSDWYLVYRTVDQGCGLFLPTEYAYVGVFYVLMHVHPCYQLLIYVFQYSIIVWHLTYVPDTGYQWAPLHVRM
jgi:hypothetical protein